MRNPDEKLLEDAKDVAYIRQISIEEAIEILKRPRSSEPLSLKLDPVSGLVTFDPPGNAMPVTSEMVARALEVDDIRYVESVWKRCTPGSYAL